MDECALAAARRLGRSAARVTGLARLAGARGLDVRGLESGLVRLDLAHGRAMDHCPGGPGQRGAAAAPQRHEHHDGTPGCADRGFRPYRVLAAPPTNESHPEEIMPTVSESLARLSASMAGLSQRAKEAEDHLAAARKETREELEARVAEAKATAQRRR